MMSLSKIYKLDRNVLRKSEIYLTKPGAGDPDDDSFLALDSLWQSSDTEYVDVMNRLKEEQERVERETREMLETAKAQVDQIEKEAHDKGFNAGKEEALAEEQKKQQAMRAQFDQLVNDFEQDRKRLHDHYELDILSLVKLMVERVLHHEVTVNPMVIETCLKTAMSYVVQNAKVKINLHKDDLTQIQQATLEKPQLLDRAAQVELTEDPAISQGGCFLETGFGEIDATLETRRDKIYKALDAIFVKALEGSAAREEAAREEAAREEAARKEAARETAVHDNATLEKAAREATSAASGQEENTQPVPPEQKSEAVLPEEPIEAAAPTEVPDPADAPVHADPTDHPAEVAEPAAVPLEPAAESTGEPDSLSDPPIIDTSQEDSLSASETPEANEQDLPQEETE